MLTSNNPTIQQSQTIQQSNNPTIQQSSNPTIQQSNNPTIQQSGMGPGLVRKLVRKGIQGIITPEKDPEKAVQAYLEGVLETLSVGEHRCKDHHHD
jgi:hypothetical protein